MVDLDRDGRGFNGSGRKSSAILFPEVLVVGLEDFCCLSDSVVRYSQKVLVCVRQFVATVTRSKHEV